MNLERLESHKIQNYVKQSLLDLINMNAYVKFGENLSICSQDIEWKHNSGVNQGP